MAKALSTHSDKGLPEARNRHVEKFREIMEAYNLLICSKAVPEHVCGGQVAKKDDDFEYMGINNHSDVVHVDDCSMAAKEDPADLDALLVPNDLLLPLFTLDETNEIPQVQSIGFVPMNVPTVATSGISRDNWWSLVCR